MTEDTIRYITVVTANIYMKNNLYISYMKKFSEFELNEVKFRGFVEDESADIRFALDNIATLYSAHERDTIEGSLSGRFKPSEAFKSTKKEIIEYLVDKLNSGNDKKGAIKCTIK